MGISDREMFEILAQKLNPPGGFEFDSEDNLVTIDFSFTYLKQFPVDILEFHHLKVLDLSGNQLLTQLQDLIAQINKTNLQVSLPDGTTLTDALARRDIASQRYSIISDLADTASNRIDRYGRTEIRKLATVNVAALRHQLDEQARQRRELDTAIQATNWTVDLIVQG